MFQPRWSLYFCCFLLVLFSCSIKADPIFAVDTQNQLVIFDSKTPERTTVKPITGLSGIFNGIDFRPSNSQLYALTVDSNDLPARIYRINPGTGQAAFVTFTSQPILGFWHSIDFDPVTDKLRVVCSGIDAPSYIVDVDSGQTEKKAVLKYYPASNGEENTSNIAGLAYTNNVANAPNTMLWGIDIGRDILVKINPPNYPEGTVFSWGSLGVDTTSLVGFDVQQGTGEAFAILDVEGSQQLYNIDLQNPYPDRLKKIGMVGSGGSRLMDFAIRRAQPQTFVVNSTSDEGNGVCDATECTLREAIEAANAVLTDDTIAFNIPTTDTNRDATTGVFTITPNRALPQINDTVFIDGYSQPGASPNSVAQGNNAVLLIEINGENAGSEANGLVLFAPYCRVRGLVVNRFGDSGIRLQNDPSTYNIIEGNFIGTDASGTRVLGNKNGVLVDANPYNLIGGTTPQSRNLISANRENGILCGHFTYGLGTYGNRIEGNYIGTDRSGTTPLGNYNGVHLARGAGGINIGGINAGNLISGNRRGILLDDSEVNDNKVLGNTIGADVSGLLPLPNTFSGIEVDISDPFGRTSANLIGGVKTGEGNLIAFNGTVGIWINNGDGIEIRGNSIFDNNDLGISFGNYNQGHFIPTPNDESSSDSDFGPNGRQNYPILSSAAYQNGHVMVSGRLKSLASTKFVLDFYDAGQPNATGNYEPRKYLSSTEVITDSSGFVSFTADVGNQAGGTHITATATNQQAETDEFGSTSEISPVLYVLPAFHFSSNEFHVSEDVGKAAVTLERSSTQGSATVDFEITAVTAQAGKDFVNYPEGRGTATFADGESRATIPLQIVNDTLDEPTETINLRLLNPSAGYILAQPIGTRVFIEDNDAQPNLTIYNVGVEESSGVDVNANFRITLSAPSAKTVSVNAIPYESTAKASEDFVAGGIRLVFAPGETVKTFSIPVKGDFIDEATELFYVVLSSPINAGISNGRGRGVIYDNDEPPAISVADVTLKEGSAGQRAAVFMLKLSAPSGQLVRVSYSTANNSALRDSDYIATAGVATFGIGSTVAYVRVPVIGDTANEADETFFLNLFVPNNATLEKSQGVGTILNDDSLPSLTLSDASISEGNLGSKDLIFTVTLSALSGQNVTVNYATNDGTARSSSDFVARNGTLSFAPDETSKTFSVAVNGDTQVEEDETLYVLLSGSTNAVISRGRGKGTILNDDNSG